MFTLPVSTCKQRTDCVIYFMITTDYEMFSMLVSTRKILSSEFICLLCVFAVCRGTQMHHMFKIYT